MINTLEYILGIDLSEIILTWGSFLSPKIRDFIIISKEIIYIFKLNLNIQLLMEKFIHHMNKAIYLNMTFLKLLIPLSIVGLSNFNIQNITHMKVCSMGMIV